MEEKIEERSSHMIKEEEVVYRARGRAGDGDGGGGCGGVE